MSEGPPSPAPECPFHPEQGAVGPCQRCGTFTCVACLALSGARGWCRACDERSRMGSASTRAVTSGILGGVGLCCVFLPGLLGLLLGYLELRGIERGDSPRAGLQWARAGVVLGWMNVGMAVAVGLTWAWLGLSRGS